MTAASEQNYAATFSVVFIRRRKEKSLFFPDSMSSVESLSGFKPELDLARKIPKDYKHLTDGGK